MILDGVVSSALDIVSYYSPLIFFITIFDVEYPLLIPTPLVFLYDRVQVIVPSLTALLADTAFKRVSDVSPFLGAFALYQHQHFLVFFLGPRTFDQTWIENFLPAVEALDISAIR